MKALIPILLFLVLTVPSLAQNKPGTQLHIKKAKGEIKVDGILDEDDWKTADVAKDWYLNYPVDTARAPKQTEARVTFDEHYFYFSFMVYDDESRDMINSLRRDFDYERNDNIGMNIGPYNDRLNGFFFTLTPAGVQMEGTMSAGGATPEAWNIYWDNKWYSKVVRYKDYWIAEGAIPFKSFRYKSGIKEWNIAFDRLDKKRNHKSAWIHTPIQFSTGAFAYGGQLIWDDPIPPAHTNISLIPFVAGRFSDDKLADPEKTKELQVGFDAKVAVTPSMNLDLTVNPDFSQIEVDQQVINLTRFEFQFPERRTFFLENSDLFANAGFPPARTFFSRRIGLVKGNDGLYTRVPIAFGARLSGSINRKWRTSLMNMQTSEKTSLGLPAQNYSVATVQRNFWKQSNVSLTYADKESLHVGEGDTAKYFHESIFINKGGPQPIRNNYNRVLTADLELLSEDNKWSASAYASKSFDPIETDKTMSAGLFFSHSSRKFNASLGGYSIDKNYNAEMGFVPSYKVYPGQFSYLTNLAYKMYPTQSKIVWMGPTLDMQNTHTPDGTLTDRFYTLGYDFRLLNTAQVKVMYNYIYQRLTSEFNPIGNYETFKVGEEYSWQNIMITAMTNQRTLVNFTGTSSFGGFYNGTNFNLTGQLNYRYQPYGNISMRVDYNDVRLKMNYGREKLFLVGPRIDLTFTDKLFLTTYLQYNNLLENVNLNARFQWRYKPASDFFIVYTENYFPENFGSKNRALVFKFTYWFNL
ncbi:MAG TPA: DUF5916 domain-containing protein [Cyclobacteriaceae bacterium]|nr:DUF5916 domain-containing protein [Cyclobacteriaceae bacterium]